MSTSELPSTASLRPDFIWGVSTSSFPGLDAGSQQLIDKSSFHWYADLITAARRR